MLSEWHIRFLSQAQNKDMISTSLFILWQRPANWIMSSRCELSPSIEPVHSRLYTFPTELRRSLLQPSKQRYFNPQESNETFAHVTFYSTEIQIWMKQILSSEGANITIPRQRIRILCIIVRLNISTKSNTQASDKILSDKHIWHKQFLQFVLSILSRSQGSMANPKMILALFPMTTDLVFPSTYSDSPDNHLRFGIRIPPETFLKLSLSKEIWYGNNKPKMLTAYLWTQLAPHCRPKFVDRLAISHPLGSAVLQDVEHELTFEIQWMSKRDL